MSRTAFYIPILLALAVSSTLPGTAIALQVDNVSIATSVSYAVLTASGDDQRSEIEILPTLDLRPTANASLRASARLRFDASYPLGSKSLNDNYGDASGLLRWGDHTAVELRDFYWEQAVGNWYLKLGKQQIVWGALDGIKLLDAINPQSFQEFILRDFSDSRITLWSGLLSIPVGMGQLQLVWSPDSTSHEFAADGSAYAFRAPRFRFGFPLDPDNESQIARMNDHSGDNWDDPTLGARLSLFFKGWDLAASVLRGKAHRPVGAFVDDNGRFAVESRFQTRTLFGFSAQKSVGDFIFRTELGWRRNNAFNTLGPDGNPATLTIEDRDQLGLAFALDWNAPADIFVNVQLYHDKVLDAPENLVRPDDETLLTLYARRRFLYDTLQLELRWYTMAGKRDDLLRPAISWELSDNTRLRLQTDLFYGSMTGVFGQFRDSSRVLLVLEHVF